MKCLGLGWEGISVDFADERRFWEECLKWRVAELELGVPRGLLFVFEGVLVEEGVDGHGPGKVFVAFLLEGGEAALQEVEGFGGRELGSDGLVETSEFFIFGAGLGEELGCFVLGSFEILRLVHEEKGLERGVGALAAGDAGVAAWGIEDRHLGRGEPAFPEGVNGASGVEGGGIGLERVGVRGGEGDHFPDAGGLRGFDGTSPHFGIEESGDSEELVADDFGVEPGSGAPGEEEVLGVGFEIDRGAEGGLLIGLGEDERLHEGFDIPA